MKKEAVKLIPVSLLLAFTLSACMMNKVPPKKITTTDWPKATAQVSQQYTPIAEKHLTPHFQKAAISYPPKQVAFLAFKKEKKIELWAKNPNTSWTHIKNYPLTASSGKAGPKLKEKDFQIPEGIYGISFLHPFSTQHLSMKIDYPNAFDRRNAQADGRTRLGGDIFLHGKDSSAGCLAVGDHAISELFVLVNHVGTKNTKVIIAPHDMRKSPVPPQLAGNSPHWTPTLYNQINKHLQPFGSTSSMA